MHVIRGLLGLMILIAILWAVSRNRCRINWRLVVSGMALQLVIAVVVLKVPGVKRAFEVMAGFFVHLMDFTREGSVFLFGSLVADTSSFGFIFAFQVLPTIVFFSALSSLLYYAGILQRVVYAIAWLMQRTMQLSGAESLATAANVFVGQTEAPLVVKPYLETMTRSEILSLMTGGMATIAGGVFAAYIGMLGGTDPAQLQFFATHLLVASLISAPAALVAAKMILPQTEAVDTQLLVPRHAAGSNPLDAIANGTSDGVRLAVNVAAMLLVFLAFIAMINYVLYHWVGDWSGLNERIVAASDGRQPGLRLQWLLGLLFAPMAWVIGIPAGDLLAIGQLLGEKTILNEFVAYASLAELKAQGAILNSRSVIITTYALCGFANVSSIGIQIGGISAIAPSQRKVLSQLGWWALVAGTMACLMTACIAGMLV
ncbi:MAG: Na+ dependent nucleoside transporter [Verrucomicrobia bacterium]|nr:Na+ dependent nucleoside transporter [Verrucomicrobiota bacterium]